VTYRLDHFGLSESVLAAADLRDAAEASAGLTEAADAVVRRLGDSFVDGAGDPALRWVRWYRATDGADEPLVAEIARRLALGSGGGTAVASRASDDGPVLGFGGALGDGDAFVVVMAPTVPTESGLVERLSAVAAGVRSGLLVDAFARRWGTRPTPDGKVVWAELTVDDAPPPT
jgi:hypothetical protein